MHIDLMCRDEYDEVVRLLRENGWADEAIPSRRIMVTDGDAWTVTDDDELAGYIRVLSDGEKVTYVCELVVALKFRGQGLARQLLEHVAHKYPTTRIDVLSTLGAKAFYEATGFTAKPGYRRYP